jgi:hypothetical protein
MAVLIECISVVIRADSLRNKFPGGWEAFKEIVPNKTLCADDELVRVGFMTPDDVKLFVSRLEKYGLEYRKDDESVDMVVVDQLSGFLHKCSWAEFGIVDLDGNKEQLIKACRLVGSTTKEIVTPEGWKYKGSLSQTFTFVPSEHIDKTMKFLRYENGVDVYLDLVNGKEVYSGRTS